MSGHNVEHGPPKGGLLEKKALWLGLGAGIFFITAFIVPTPQSMIDIVEKYGFGHTMIKWGVASDMAQAAWKAKLVVGIIPMATIYFATEALPIGLVGILMPILAYFFHIIPMRDIGKTFAGDCPMFLLGVLAMGVSVTEVGLHKRIAVWLIGWTKGFLMPIFVLCISMACIGSFISAHAVCAFMAPVMAAIYFSSVRAVSPSGRVIHDPLLGKMLLLAMCYGLNVGGVGSPAAGGRNVLMLGFWQDYNVPMSFGKWMLYGYPMVPVLGLVVAMYMVFVFRKVKVRDITPGLKALKAEIKEMGPMSKNEKIVFGMLILILLLWLFKSELLGLGGPALLALFIPVLFKVTDWKKILSGISWDAWFMYCGAMTLGALLKETGAALWLAQSALGVLAKMGAGSGLGLWIGVGGLSGLMTNFMSDAATCALLGPIAIPMGIFSGAAGEPWGIGLATAFATSFAHFLIVGTPNNAITYGLGIYPDSGEKILHPFDFVKYGFILWVLSMLIMVVVGFVITFSIVGFPEGLTETARAALEAGAKAAAVEVAH